LPPRRPFETLFVGMVMPTDAAGPIVGRQHLAAEQVF
jgi:hypothetical protein